MTHIVKAGDIARVIQNNEWPRTKRPNLVRAQPRIGGRIRGRIPENASLTILPRFPNGQVANSHDDRVHSWYWVRGTTGERLRTGKLRIVEGWTAVSENGIPFVERVAPNATCHDRSGSSLDTFLNTGKQAYVLTQVALRAGAGTNSRFSRWLFPGRDVEVLDGPYCVQDMVWWQVKVPSLNNLVGFVSESGDDEVDDAIREWYLCPLT